MQQQEGSSPSEIKTTFERREGAVDGNGQRYEVNVALWMLLRGLRRKDEFYLACNVKRFGNLDDICYKYKYDNEWHLLLFQLKHKTSKKSPEDFVYQLFAKCYTSYLDGTKNLNESDAFGNVKEENIHCVIFTNIPFLDTVVLKCFNEKSVIDHLTINSYRSFQICDKYYNYYYSKLNECKRGGKISKMGEDKIRKSTKQQIGKMLQKEGVETYFNKTNFTRVLMKLIICQEQPNDATLNKLIHDEIADMCDVDSERVYDDLIKKMTYWHENSNIPLSRDNFYQVLQDCNTGTRLELSYISRLNLSYIPRIITNSKEDKIVDERILNPDEFESPMVLVGDPGEGKSTIINYLTQIYKSDVTVLTIKLGRATKGIPSVISTEDIPVTCERFLRHCLHYKLDERYQQILKFTKQDYFFLLLDGYDEIVFGDENVKFKIDVFLKALSKKFNILISTRKPYEFHLQELINGHIYYIKQFDLSEQKMCAKHFFRNNRNTNKDKVNDEKLEKMIEEIFKLSQNIHFLDKQETFLAVPLQLEMFLELFVDKFSEYYNDVGQMKLHFKFNNLFDLYSKFVENKIDLYLKRSNMMDCPKRVKDRTKSNIYADHFYYAFEDFYTNLNCHEFKLTEDELIEIGFMNMSTAEHAHPHSSILPYAHGVKFSSYRVNYIYRQLRIDRTFVHRTFAEYFLAHGLTGNLKEYRERVIDHMDLDHFLGKMLNAKLVMKSAENFRMINDNLDEFKNSNNNETDEIGRTPLHIAIIIGADKISDYLIKNKICIGSRDALGATPFRYAVQYDRLSSVAQLISSEECDIQFRTYTKNCLYYAIDNRNTAMVELLLKHPKCPINEARINMLFPWPVLHYALKSKNLTDIAKLILSDIRCDVNSTSYDKETCLHYAVKYNDIDIVNLLLERDCPINAQTERKNETALHWALSFNAPESAIALVYSKRCDLSLVTFDGQTSLHYAVKYNMVEVVKLLLEFKNSLLNLQTSNKKTALHFAVEVNSLEIVELLIKANCDCNIVDYREETPLHYAVKDRNLINIAKILLNTTNVFHSNIENETCLHLASKSDNIEITTILLNWKDYPINAVDSSGNTALHYAIHSEPTKTSIALLNSQKCDLNLANKAEYTCLHQAARYNNIEVVKLLLSDENCLINFQMSSSTSSKLTALHLAVRANSPMIVKLLLEANCDPNLGNWKEETALHYAAKNKNLIDIAKILLNSSKCDISLGDSKNKTCLYLAAKANNVELVKLLLTYEDCPINIQTTSRQQTALHVAIRYDATEAALMLINSNRCDLSLVNCDRETCLHCAYRDLEMIIALLATKNCPINAQTKWEETVLHLAVLWQRPELVSLLLDAKCDCTLKDYRGDTPYEIACSKNYSEIIEIFNSKLQIKETEINN